MYVSRRQINLIKAIHENPSAGMKELGDFLAVSMQTVRADLYGMKKLMADYGVRVELLPGNRLRVWGRENINYMLGAFQTMQEFSFEKQIMLVLLLDDGFVVMQDIADKLFASKSLIEKIMSLLLKKYPDELQSARRHGIRNVSSQLERRNRFSEIVGTYIRGVDFRQEIKAFHENHFPLLDYAAMEDVDRAAEAVRLLRDNANFSFTDESLVFLFLQLLFAGICRKRWRTVPMGNLVGGMLSGLADNAGYGRAAACVCRAAGLDEPEEIAYFTYLMHMLRKQTVADISGFAAAMEPVLEEILACIYRNLSIDFTGDDELRRGLMVHLYTTVIRRDMLVSGLAEQSGMEIKRQYPLGFDMSAIAAGVIMRRYNYKISDGEMMYMTMHFQAGIERMKAGGSRVRILVVCHYGLAAASLIAAKIEGYFPAADVVAGISMQRFQNMPQVKADLILSTENIGADAPVIYVTPMLPEREIQSIRSFIDTRCVSNMLLLHILNAIVLDMESAGSREEVLQAAAGELLARGLVTEEYPNSVMEREEASPTDIMDIAVPHGSPEFVRETQLVIVRLARPLLWAYSEVRYVFMFAVSKAQFEKNMALFASFYKRLLRGDVRSELKRHGKSSPEELRKSLAHALGG